MEYNFQEIEQKWRKFWADNQTFKAKDASDKEKYYVLDMFPYPSGAGLHVGHPLGYIASDIYARYKRLKGFNVLHPMGYDSFGLPAEQYAIQTGQHPDTTTKENILRYRDQLDQIGFSFDWSREVRTSDASYYKWTQWIFIQLFESWYNNKTQKAEAISELISHFEKEGNANIEACSDCEKSFSAEDWKQFSEAEKETILQEYRLAFLADSWVNWCPALGTVLANDEVINGVSERGGHPVEQKLMRQWSMRIKAYAERLITGLEKVDWTESIKDIQRNWIGKSVGCSLEFKVDASTGSANHKIEVFTTRPDTVFGVTFLVLAPEHPLVAELTTADKKEAVEKYIKASSLKTERDRQANVKNISGEFIGSYAIHPFTGEKVALWIGDYVLASYGTGAVMAVPCGDQRDWDFAKHFDIEIKNIFENIDISEQAYSEKVGKIADSDFLSGLEIKEATKKAIEKIESLNIGKGKTNYRLRDAVFSRQRYWGEPFPVYYQNGLPKMIDAKHLPIVLPEVKNYLPTPDGQPPLGNAKEWAWNNVESRIENVELIDNQTIFPLELNTMPGWAGSSWYFLRYMDSQNENEFVSKKQVDYWKNVDLYVGGSEHGTGHLLYSRFWTKFLFDKGFIGFDEPFKKMINQGMILGRSSLAYRLNYALIDHSTPEKTTFDGISGPTVFITKTYYDQCKPNIINAEIHKNKALIKKFEILLEKSGVYYNDYMIDSISEIHLDISLIDNDILNIEAFKNWREDYKDAEFILEEDGTFICGSLIEKMSKSLYNVQTPDELVTKFGADTLRMYEMFLGPLEQAKPWDTKGINGVSNFLRKLWRLFNFDEQGNAQLNQGEVSKDNLKTLHKCIQKVTDDLNRFSFNTGVSNFMICVNELTEQKCASKEILEQLVILISPYAPHIAEELWVKLGNEAGTISYAQFPSFNPEYLVSDAFSYPISFNGKVRFNIEFPVGMDSKEIESQVLAHENTAKYLEGKTPKKMIVVPGRIVNVVV
ncbi:MAG: class I tRNA ligase family protein [Bacteroidota bacterium]